jgi:hypothetical protein
MRAFARYGARAGPVTYHSVAGGDNVPILNRIGS